MLPFSGLQDAIPKDLLVSDPTIMSARVLAINATTRQLINCAWWQRQGLEMEGPKKLIDGIPTAGQLIDPDYPWCVTFSYIQSIIFTIISKQFTYITIHQNISINVK